MTDDRLFEGTASYYAKYRPPYPDEMIADIVSHFGLDGGGWLLDLGCGPGTLTFSLAPHFEKAIAIDIEPEMIAEAERLSDNETIEWRVMRGEEISPAMGSFRLITAGSSFHWMDRDLMLERISTMLEEGAGVAFAGGSNAWWGGPEEWHRLVTAVIQRYLGPTRRAGQAKWPKYVDGKPERFQQTLRRNGWRVELERDYDAQCEWDVESLLGFLWSTSFAGRELFGERVEDFERELRAELVALEPSGVFREEGGFGVVCARPPQ